MARSFLRTRTLLCAALLLSPAGALAEEPKPAVLDVPGMNSLDAQVDLDTRRAVVRYDGEKATPEQLAKAVSDAGYRATVVRK